uniref:Phosphorylated adapter RNA export protein n=1 Tax=Amblyomma maculatum TaxID=34609 RepID=G3MLL6_AMBMU
MNSVNTYRDERAYATSDDDSEHEETSWKRQATEKARDSINGAGYDFAKRAALEGAPQLGSFPKCAAFEGASQHESFTAKKKKVNNVWGAVLTEQLLTEDLNQVTVASDGDSERVCRQVESYNYSLKHQDTRPDPIEPDDLFDEEYTTPCDVIDIQDPGPRGQKRSVKDRLGERTCTRPSRSRSPKRQDTGRARRFASESSRSSGSEPDEAEAAKLVADIASRLGEPKVDIIERVVNVLGVTESRKLLNMTEDIESTGGLLIRNKTRRRTPGGVFFYLVKVNTSRYEAKLIFQEDHFEREQHRREYKKERSRRIREKHANRAAAAVPLDIEPPEEEPASSPSGDAKVAAMVADEDLEDGEIVD